jgi:hypothetical protein
VNPVTAGEKLYLLIRDRMLESSSEASTFWASAKNVLGPLGGSANFPAYFKGAAAVHVTRRILRYWMEEKPSVGDEAMYVRNVSTFVRREVFPSLANDDITRVSRAVIEAERAAGKPISGGCRKNVLREQRGHSCYLCGKELDAKAGDGEPCALTLEHLWPTSMGGDSVEANLLPACTHCQRDSQDAISWEWANVHNLVLSSSPSASALKSVNGKLRYARHYLEAMTLADAQHLTLKEAFMRLGHMKSPITHSKTSLPVTFFDLQTV